MPRSHVTIRDVARQAGVSRQTVSRVINNSDRVSEQTRTAVEIAIADLGYRPNAIARHMAKGRTATLACIAPNLTDYTFAGIIDGAETAVRAHNYYLLSTSARDEAQFADLIDELVVSRRVEGLLLINPHIDNRIRHLPADFPVVFAGARPRSHSCISSVSLDDTAVGRTATEHLLQLGHTCLLQITGPAHEECAQDRAAGFDEAVAAAGTRINTLTRHGDWSATSGDEALMRVAQTADRMPTAVFAHNDAMAVGVLKAADRLALQIPQDLSVIGVDDIPLAAYLTPALTTMHQDFARIGREAAELLIRALSQPKRPIEQRRLPSQLTIRQSTKRKG